MDVYFFYKLKKQESFKYVYSKTLIKRYSGNSDISLETFSK